jgi:hypothetical protein
MTIPVDLIDIGALANDGTGDPLRVAFDKINNNFTSLASFSFPTPSGIEGSLQFKTANTYTGSPNLYFDTANNRLQFNSNISVVNGSTVDIGTRANPIHKIYVSNDGLDLGNVNLSESGNVISFSIVGSPGAKISLAGLNDIQVSGNLITTGDTALGNSLAYGNSIIGSFKTTTPDATPNQVIYQVPTARFTSATFKVTSSRKVGTNYTQSVVLNVILTGDEATVKYTAHSTVFSGVLPVTTYNVDRFFGNIRIMVSPQFNDPIIHLVSYEIDN